MKHFGLLQNKKWEPSSDGSVPVVNGQSEKVPIHAEKWFFSIHTTKLGKSLEKSAFDLGFTKP